MEQAGDNNGKISSAPITSVRSFSGVDGIFFAHTLFSHLPQKRGQQSGSSVDLVSVGYNQVHQVVAIKKLKYFELYEYPSL